MLAKIGLNEDTLKEAVKALKEWLKQQPHLPSEFEDDRMERWIVDTHNSLERTKSCLEMYFSLKNIIPEFLTHRDPAAPWFRKATDLYYVVPLPGLTPEYSRVIVCGATECDPSKFCFLDFCKLAFLFHDLRKRDDFSLSLVYVLDMTNYSAGYLTKISVPTLRKVISSHKKCFVLPIHAVHLINAKQDANIILGLIKSVVAPKVMKRVYIHSNGLETLYQHVPRQNLPNEYGGEAGKLDELYASWKKHMESSRDWLLEQDRFRSDETKRPGKAISAEDIFGVEGSFRQLSID